MATFGNYPPNYLLFNKQLSKSLAIVMVIEGIPFIFSSSQAFTAIRYGDAGIFYGQPGLLYGGLRAVGGPNGVGGVSPWIMLDAGMIIQQRLEPEQGKGNIGTLTMSLIDYQGQVSFFIAPGNVVPEIMCSKQVTIYLGFQQTSYPEDYLIIYRGYITKLQCPPNRVMFQISDGTMKSRQPIFDTPSTRTTTPIDTVQTSIPVLNTSGFFAQILGPNGLYDPIVNTFIVIDSEIMSYGSAGIPDNLHFTVTRAALGSTVATHSADAQVSNSIQFGINAEGGGVNFIILALKLLLSGWGTYCETGIKLLAIGFAPPNVIANGFTLLTDDAFLDLGLTVGDYFQITGATNVGNNLSGRITGFQNLNAFTRIILTDQTFIEEQTTNATVSFRSKYDTLPLAAGSKCRMRDVDVAGMENVLSKYFQSGIYQVAIYYNSPVFAKDTIAQDLFLPFGCYQISRFGRISISVAKPPLPGIGRLVILDYTNVLDPQNIVVDRSQNNRTFYNQISFEYDYDIIHNSFNSVQYFVDATSASLFDQVLTLPITAKGVRTTFGGGAAVQQRGQALLTRYSKVALMIDLTVNWSAGSTIEVSDVVQLNDNGNLKIMNFETGIRDLGSQLFEVIDRSFDVVNGNVKLKLLGGLGFSVTSRFGCVSPSSQLNTGSTSTLLRLTPSYGQTTITNEVAKWTPFLGLPVVVHSPDYAVTGSTTLVSQNATDTSALDVSPALGFTPLPGYLLEIANYPSDTNPNTNGQYKSLYAYVTPTVPVVSGISNTQFTVSSGNIGKFIVGNTLIVRKNNWDPVSYSPEVAITSAVTGTNTVTVAKSLGYTPDNTYSVDGLGFPDHTSFYRYD